MYLPELVRRLRKAGADGHTAQSLRNLANIMASHEELLIESLKIDNGRTRRYCRTVNPDFLKRLNEKSPQQWQNLRTSGTPLTTQIPAEVTTTTAVVTTS